MAGSGGATHAAAGAGSSGSSFMAIDGKIEQAMDLVKTHLMYAVREEVEQLRHRIVQLEKTVGLKYLP